MPVFYRDVMYREGAEGKDEAYLKLYDGHDWKWFCVRLEHTDMEYLRKYWSGKKASAPTLEKLSLIHIYRGFEPRLSLLGLRIFRSPFFF